jgi:hypothetical protein
MDTCTDSASSYCCADVVPNSDNMAAVVKTVYLTLFNAIFSPTRVIKFPLNIHILVQTLSRDRI